MMRASSNNQESTALYVHLPFCRVKCTYCAFAISTDLRLEERYVSALIEEMDRRVPRGTRLESVYFGGGTPSRVSPSQITRISQELARRQIAAEAEVTIEVNPEDVDRESLERWVGELGVNRVSIGVQSFHDEELTPLGRQHGRERAIRAVETSASIVPRVSIDLILGLPNQTVESVRASAETATSLPVGHISLYLLDLEPGSALESRVNRQLTSLPSDEATAEMYREVVDRAESGGLLQYEVSNFAKPGQEAVHNRRYWQRDPYIGVGIGSHSFDGAVRTGNVRSIHEYMTAIESDQSPIDLTETLTDEDVRHERLFLGMRQTAGLRVDEFRRLAGEGSGDWLAESTERGWVRVEEDRVRFTIEGFLVSDELLAQLF